LSLWCGKRCRQNVRHGALMFDTARGSVVIDDMGPLERALVRRYANRIRMGQEAYGLLSVEKKDWAKEALEESLDLQVYSDMLLIRLELNGGK